MQQHQPDQSPAETATHVVNSEPETSVERLRYLEHKGKRVLLVDLSACAPEQLLECIKAVPQYITRQPEHSLLALGDFTGAQFTKEAIEQLKIAAVFDRPHIAKSAWVLSDNLHKVLLDSIRTFSKREIAVFSTREEALDYLVS
jgi:hypothetical protein